MNLSAATVFLLSIVVFGADTVDGRNPKRVRRLSKQGERRQLRVKGEGKSGKGGKGYSYDGAESIDNGAVDNSTISNDFDDAISNDVDDAISNDGSHLDLICDTFKRYSDLDAAANNSFAACDSLESFSPLLCPNVFETSRVCEAVQQDSGSILYDSLKENYCIPLFDEMFHDTLKMEECVSYCSTYVSGGDCCSFSCN